MSKRKSRTANPTALPPELDGPPAGKGYDMRAPVLRGPGDDRGNPELRAAVVEAAEWRDPADIDSARARGHGARPIHGWRRVWTIASLHVSCPREITAAHVRAAERLLGDYERGEAMIGGGGANLDRVDCPGPGAISDERIDACERYREAMGAVGVAGAAILRWVVVDNWTVSRLGVQLGLHRDRAHGRLYAALERLREHYWPPRADRAIEAPTDVLEPVAGVVGLEGLAAERLGRWRVV